jgi:hypothetical protein
MVQIFEESSEQVCISAVITRTFMDRLPISIQFSRAPFERRPVLYFAAIGQNLKVDLARNLSRLQILFRFCIKTLKAVEILGTSLYTFSSLGEFVTKITIVL